MFILKLSMAKSANYSGTLVLDKILGRRYTVCNILVIGSLNLQIPVHDEGDSTPNVFCFKMSNHLTLSCRRITETIIDT